MLGKTVMLIRLRGGEWISAFKYSYNENIVLVQYKI